MVDSYQSDIFGDNTLQARWFEQILLISSCSMRWQDNTTISLILKICCCINPQQFSAGWILQVWLLPKVTSAGVYRSGDSYCESIIKAQLGDRSYFLSNDKYSTGWRSKSRFGRYIYQPANGAVLSLISGNCTWEVGMWGRRSIMPGGRA